MRLASVEKFMGGKRHCKESELTLCRLLSYERSKGTVSECLELFIQGVLVVDRSHSRRDQGLAKAYFGLSLIRL